MNNTVVLAMDIGGTNLRMATVTKDGTITARYRFSCEIYAGLPIFLDSIAEKIASIRSICTANGSQVLAIGSGVPGLLRLDGTVISSVNLQALDGFNLRTWLETASSLPAVTLNDANAAAVAELQYGAGRPYRSILHFTLGTGVGSGLILDGKLWTGYDGVAAEYGHTTVEPAGVLCQCGNHGCLEQYASATAIVRLAKQKLSSRGNSLLKTVPEDSLDACQVANAASIGDQLALDCFNEAGRYLGIAAAAAVNLLNLEAIILGGGVAASYALIAPVVKTEIERRAFQIPAARVKLLQGQLADDAGLLGAAAAGWNLVS